MGFHMVSGDHRSQITNMALSFRSTLNPDKVLRGSPDDGCQHSFRWQRRALTSTRPSAAMLPRQQQDFMQQHRPWTSPWPSVATWTIDINTDPGCGRITDPDMAFSGGMKQWHQHSPRWLLGPLTSTWPLICSKVLGHQHGFRQRPQLWLSAWPWIVISGPPTY